MKNTLCFTLFFFFALGLCAQNGAALQHQLQGLQNSGRVLYLAAHPDDENTRLIAWLANQRYLHTAYLSLTRGDGGQNLIGTELGAKLGVLRTQELMQARAIDGGTQFFTRAVDFGYSKTAAESFEKWGREAILGDVVRVIRQFRPDVIITRFPPDSRGGHGHHTASAILALEAYEAAADHQAFPEQLDSLRPWQVKRVFWNHSSWWTPNLDSIAAADPTYQRLEAGSYLPLLGLSCNELASYSRTQHKSQGFGVAVARGSLKEYLKLLKGEDFKEDFMEGIATNWARYGFAQGDKALAKIIKNYDPAHPAASVPALLKLHQAALAIEEETQRDWFRTKILDIVQGAMGLSVELLAPQEYCRIGESKDFRLALLNRSKLPLRYQSSTGWQDLPYNHIQYDTLRLRASENSSQAYWLRKPYQNMFAVADPALIGQAENDEPLSLAVTFALQSYQFTLSVPARYKFSDRVEGEIIRPLMVVPSAVARPDQANLIFVDQRAHELSFDLRSFAAKDLTLRFEAPGWEVNPSELQLNFVQAGEQRSLRIGLQPKSESTLTELKVLDAATGEELSDLYEIDYPHIHKRMVLEPARVKLVPLDLQKHGQRIAYLPGAGDEVPEALRQMGYAVDLLDEAALRESDLSQYQAVVAGIRAYNTQAWLPRYRQKLLDYVADGGIYLVQYNTATRDLLTEELGPYPFHISRQRVTEEDAPVRFALPEHPVLNSPNRLSQADFDGWVQERGLYFADTWDNAYAAPLGWHDKGEPERRGALLIANHGQGHFVYTGISFFRELPAGVPGAFRLLANLLSLEARHD